MRRPGLPGAVLLALPVAAGCDGVTSTVMVGMLLPELADEQVSAPDAAAPEPDPPDPVLAGQVATVPTEETTPGVVRLFGRVMLTLSPTATLVCCEASSATCTSRLVEVPCSTVSPI